MFERGTAALVSNAALVLVITGALVLTGLLVDDGYRAITGEITITEWSAEPGKGYRKYLLVGATALIPLALLVHFDFFTRS